MKLVKDVFLVSLVVVLILTAVEGASYGYLRFKKIESEIFYSNGTMNSMIYSPYTGFEWPQTPHWGHISPGKKSIVFLGGSTMMGIGASLVEKSTIGVLSKDRDFNDYNVVSFACAGYVSNQETATFVNKVYSSLKSDRLPINRST